MKRSRLLRIGPPILAALALSGCSLVHAPVFAPSGPVALAERNLMFEAIGLMLIVLIPVFTLTFWFARRYRASNPRGRYAPDWAYSAKLDLVVWLVPTAIIGGLAYLIWTQTLQLDPYRRLAEAGKPLTVQVVAEDWKWLFIYPRQNIASVNELVIPAGRPVHLALTSDTVMNSFYVPGLAGQIYAMAGMRTNLNLSADHPTDLTGRNTQYSGSGFADQSFAVKAVTAKTFKAWIAQAKRAPKALDQVAYEHLAKPSSDIPVTYYSGVEPGLFSKIVAKNESASMKRAGLSTKSDDH